jgi:hypothetical protein
MREIKFRHPIFVQGKFVEWHYWGFIDGGFQTPAIPMKASNDGRFQSYQFTGLKDKNGVEIYEGDILQLHEYGDVYKEIIYRNGCFCVHGFNWNKQACEVIGNCFENPDLLPEQP